LLNMTAAATHWSYDITVAGRDVSSAGQPTLEAALADAITHATYYLAQYPGQPVAITKLRELCNTCSNEGTVPDRKLYQRKKCPACKGKCPAAKLDDIPVRLSNGNGGRGYRIVEAA
jgi:hypothetical protein